MPPEADMLLNGKNGLRFRVYSPPELDRIWSRWGSYYNMPKAIFHLLKDYRV